MQMQGGISNRERSYREEMAGVNNCAVSAGAETYPVVLLVGIFLPCIFSHSK